MSIYPDIPFPDGRGTASALLVPNREADAKATVQGDLPGNVIMIHGVNDVGVAYEQAEQGLCLGMNDRAGWSKQLYQPAKYRMPQPEEIGKLEPDPDAVFFKRHADKGHYSPVLPFYWGFREDKAHCQDWRKTPHGQAMDRYGTRLDRDFSKGGGPFANATNSLPDMWNRGFHGAFGIVDSIGHDALRRVVNGPGRMYMVLAAQRLAALVSMIRDFDANEAVSIVAHSQGCLVSLLAQAFLVDKGLRPADVLVMTHPPYSLVDDYPVLNDAGDLLGGGKDAAMADGYAYLNDWQTLHGRLQTLVNIVQAVAKNKNETPKLAEFGDPKMFGMVSTRWKPEEDRDNRGKVYLYFCPEDMTVALGNMQGIGWQGVPDYASGTRVYGSGGSGKTETRQPVKELGPTFLQRVFTAKQRVPAKGDKGSAPVPELVGTDPHDFALRLEGENDQAHADPSQTSTRGRLEEGKWPPDPKAKWLGVLPMPAIVARKGIRSITGEKLRKPVAADMYAGGVTLPGKPKGAHETVDPIDAATSVVSDYGMQLHFEKATDPEGQSGTVVRSIASPAPQVHPGPVTAASDATRLQLEARLKASASAPEERRADIRVWRCLVASQGQVKPTGELLICYRESANDARLRQQQTGIAARSFHSAIFGSSLNHRHVTAYDVAIGGGLAVTHPVFREYLCAVADWRLKKTSSTKEKVREGILTWGNFLSAYGMYYDREPAWRKALIEGNCDYYTTGKLPSCLPVLPTGLPRTIVCETMHFKKLEHPPAQDPRAGPAKQKTASSEFNDLEGMA